MLRRCGRNNTRVNHPAETPKQHWRICVYYPFLDNLIMNLNHVFHAQHLLPRAVDKLTDDHVATIYEAYQIDIYLSLEDFRREVARWRTHWVITKRNDWPKTLCTTLNYVNPVPYPSIDTILIKLCFVNHASSKRYC